jgi:hypothetical protein
MTSAPARALTLTAALTFTLSSLLSGCAEPAEKLVPHFEALAAEAESHKLPACHDDPATADDCVASKCQKLGAKLNDYLKQHTQDMAALISQHGQSAPATAQRLYIASTRIDAVVQLCNADKGISTFKHDLSKLISTHTAPR